MRAIDSGFPDKRDGSPPKGRPTADVDVTYFWEWNVSGGAEGLREHS
jgi:hypothetical protein